ncbi:MAG: ribonuclease R [Pseudomonadota bacterium]
MSQLPTKQAVLEYVTSRPAKVGKREIAKAFNLKGSDRVALKEMLREMADDGMIERRRKVLAEPGALPAVGVLEVIGQDEEGEPIAIPARWDGTSAAPKVRILAQSGRRGRSQPAPGRGDRVLAHCDKVSGQETPYTGRIIKVLPKDQSASLGIFRAGREGGRVIPVDKKAGGRELRVPEGEARGAKDGDLVSISVRRPTRLGLPQAEIREIVADAASEKAVSLIAIHAHDIRHTFPADVLAEAEAATPVPLGTREDWRALPLLTIDPASAKDHDDAVHAAPDEDPANEGGWIVTVAIADVAAYVTPKSASGSSGAMDREAWTRGNSVYFPDRVVPMLPERISNDLCSLREHEDRPALAVRMTFDARGNKRRHAFHRVMMRSHAKLSYEQAQAAIDGQPDETTAPLLDHVLRPLWSAYAALKAARDARAPLDLDLPERKLVLDEAGRVERVIVPERLDAHRLIEECMIQANVAAAETLEAKRMPLLYRIHDAPAVSKLEALREFLATLNIKLARSGNLRPEHFNAILAQTADRPQAPLVNEVVLRSQSQAVYGPDNAGHFGLALRRYAHFTSPIRRYADLVVHRALIRALGLGDGGLTDTEIGRLEETGEHISATERRAMLAERETTDRLIAGFLADQVGAKFSGKVTGVTKAGLFVRLAETGADGFVPISQLGDEYYRYDEVTQAVAGEESGTGYQLGDAVEVRLVEAAPIAGALRFEILTRGRAMKVSGGRRGRPGKGAFKRQEETRGRKRGRAR